MFSSSFTMSSTETIVQEASQIEQYLSSDKPRPSQGDIKMFQELEAIKVRLKGPQTTNISDDEQITDVHETIDISKKLTIPDVDVEHEIELKRYDQMEVSQSVMQSRTISSHTEETSAHIEVSELIGGTLQDFASKISTFGMTIIMWLSLKLLVQCLSSR